MIYEIVMKDGEVIKCWTTSFEEIIKMIYEDNIYIVKENANPEQVSIIMPERVSRFRFPKDGKDIPAPRA